MREWDTKEVEPGISKQVSCEGSSPFRGNERLTQPPSEIEIYVRRNNGKLQSPV